MLCWLLQETTNNHNLICAHTAPSSNISSQVSELIHSSDAYTGSNALDFARVNVHFAEIIDNETEDDFDIIQGTEVIISRIARRDNSSNYLIDGKNATFKKVAEYLDGKGIDLDNNRFLILQGEVEMISMMPPKGKGNDDDGLLEYLEDIIGSNKYVEDTNAAAEKVEQLSEIRQEKLNRVKAAEKEVAALSGAKSEAMGLVNKDREIRRKKNVYYQIQMMGGRKEGEIAAEEREELVIKLEESKTKLAEADARVAEIEEGFADQRAEYDAVHDELTQTKEEYTKFERQEIQMKENIKFEKSNVKKLEQKVVAETKKGEDAEVALAEAEESIPTLEEKIEECAEKKEQEDAKLEEIFEETKEVTERLRKELEVKTQQLAPLLQERSVFQNSLDTAQMEVNLLEDGVSRAKEQLENAERELASLDERQAGKKNESKEFEKQLAESKQRVEVAEEEVKELEAREGFLAKKSSELLVSIALSR
jgi:structural maintenance of chromosome 4